MGNSHKLSDSPKQSFRSYTNSDSPKQEIPDKQKNDIQTHECMQNHINDNNQNETEENYQNTDTKMDNKDERSEPIEKSTLENEESTESKKIGENNNSIITPQFNSTQSSDLTGEENENKEKKLDIEKELEEQKKLKHDEDEKKIEKKMEEANRKKYGRPASLQNIGVNCYLNSALQGISSCDGFVDDLHAKYKELNSLNEKGLEKMEVLNNLIRTLNGKDDSGDRKLEISSNSIFKEWNKPGQQDSFELLSYMINQVYNEIRQFMEDNNIIQKNNVTEWFIKPLPLRINIQYEMICDCGKTRATPIQTDLAIRLPIVKLTDTNKLSDLLDKFFEPDEIIGFDCDNNGCQDKKGTRNTKFVPELPRTISIHIQRSYWTGSSMKKINSKVEFEEILIFKSEFLAENKATQNNCNKKDLNIKKYETNNETEQKNEEYNSNNSDIDEKSPRVEIKYKLTAVIVHFGNVEGGHYVCYRRSEDKWFETNDSIITDSSWNKVKKVQPYILFYEKE